MRKTPATSYEESEEAKCTQSDSLGLRLLEGGANMTIQLRFNYKLFPGGNSL